MKPELIAVICICTKQTFTQVNALQHGFANAFSATLEAYMDSTLKELVKKEISLLYGKENWVMSFDEDLIEIIIKHQLCTVKA
ncbi:hypothetical protein M422DRAFT_773963 [Sphaerobolus stellatus SS14]|nr:hypothetical protein M422DRAFT_773963 [Sphaerobolus stellatus SS14]